MNYVLNREEMRALDKRSINELGLPSEILMETAGARCTEIILKDYASALEGEILIICGYGNNGGDGMVIARHLHCSGHRLRIMLPLEGKMSPETAANLERCRKLEIPIIHTDDPDEALWDDTTLIIDALFGIGFRGELSAELAFLIERFNCLDCVKIAIDIPSGIDADTGTGQAIIADATFAIEEYKYGHLLEAGRMHSGKVHLVKIGIPGEYKQNLHSLLLDQHDISLPLRPIDAHKGTFGLIVLIGGSMDYPGSIMLSAKAALKSGAGLVYLYSRKENLHYYACSLEIMPRFIPETGDGQPHEEALQVIIKAATAIVIGPGMGTDSFALKLLETVLQHSTVPTVIDADAITLLAQHPKLKAYLNKPNLLLTPHKAEFCRLQGLELSALNSNIMQQINVFRQQYECAFLLKGHRSIYADPALIRILASGNDALATGGSGDVLSGIIASFAAQQLSIAQACCSASLLMGSTAEHLSRAKHSFSVCPSDIIEHLGDKDE